LKLVNKIKKSAEYYLDYEEEDEEALQKEAELKGAEIWNNER